MTDKFMSVIFMLLLGIVGILSADPLHLEHEGDSTSSADHIVRYLRSGHELLGSIPTKRPSQSRDLYRLLRTLRSSSDQIVGTSKYKNSESTANPPQKGFFLRTLRGNKGFFLRTLREDDSNKGFFLRTLRSDPQKGFFLRTLKRSNNNNEIASLEDLDGFEGDEDVYVGEDEKPWPHNVVFQRELPIF
ncbi:uncharacterized protein [Lepeophtheirus salmonis]|nr:uncharacterized protein LOC121123543 [Lepeophtheirus salmonis]